jgi:sorbitol-specific phosphotransferase system component IIA
MQRLHTDDLCGSLIHGPEEWTHLKLPAIAQQDERIQIGKQRYYFRRVGDQSWSRLSEQFFRVDKWSLCRG